MAACGGSADGSSSAKGGLDPDVVFQPATESMAVLTQLSAFSGDYFAKEGLKITYNTPIPNAAQAAQSVTGNADIAIVGSSGVIPGVAAGRDMVTVATLTKGPSTQVTLRNDVIAKLGLNPSSPIADRIKALKGLTLALPQPGSSTDVIVRQALGAYGLNPDKDIKIRPITDPPALVTAMREKQVDGFAFSAPTSVQPVSEGYATVWFTISDLPEYSDMPWIDVVTSKKYLKENRPTVVKFVKALQAGADDLKNNEAAASKRIKDKYFAKLDQKTYDLSFKLALPTSQKGLEPTESGLKVLLDVVNATADKKFDVTFKQGYDASVVAEAASS
jgi:NitT/TauT family transport system substrate-binding protein